MCASFKVTFPAKRCSLLRLALPPSPRSSSPLPVVSPLPPLPLSLSLSLLSSVLSSSSSPLWTVISDSTLIALQLNSFIPSPHFSPRSVLPSRLLSSVVHTFLSPPHRLDLHFLFLPPPFPQPSASLAVSPFPLLSSIFPLLSLFNTHPPSTSLSSLVTPLISLFFSSSAEPSRLLL